MLKKAFVAILLWVTILSGVATVFAQDFGLKATAEKAQYSESADIFSIISTVLQVGLSMMGIVFLAIMFYAGLRWMTARGNEELATKAKDAMFNVAVGFVLVVAAYALTVFIFSKLGQ